MLKCNIEGVNVYKKNIFGCFIRTGFFALLFFSFFSCCFSQSYMVQRYSETDGLPGSKVNDIAQDHPGRIWFAAGSGISCYDGVSWQNYSAADGLPSLSFLKIDVDRKGRIWALPNPNQQKNLSVAFYDGGRWQQIKDLELNLRGGIKVTSFLTFSGQDGEPYVAIGSSNSGLFLWKDKKWKHLTSKKGLLSDSIYGIAELNGKCYLATGSGVEILKNDGAIDNHLQRSPDFPSKKIKGICVEHKDKFPGYHLKESKIWFFGNRRLGYFTENNDKPVLYYPGFSFANKEEELHMQPDYRGGLYIGNSTELYYFNYRELTWESLDSSNGLVSRGANSIYIDFEQNIWIACHRGVSKITSRTFANFQRVHGLLEDEVTSVAEYNPGKFVLGHNNGVTFWDGNNFTPLPFTKKDGSMLSHCRALDMEVDSKQNIWVAATDAGLCRIDKNRKIKWYGKAHGLPSRIVSVRIDKNDRCWVAGEKQIFIFDGSGFTTLTPDNFPDMTIRRIFPAKKNALYIATIGSGVYVYNKKQLENYRLTAGSSSNSVYAVYEDSRGRLLFGTLGGLFFLEKKSMKKFEEKGFKINRPVYFIVEDQKQRLWFGTDNGVVKWDGSRAIRYSISEGLIGQETNRAAGIVDGKGRIWIGTKRGISVYNEQFDNHMGWNPPPKLRLTYVEVKGRKIPLDRSIKLTPKTHSMVFHFNAISFIDEKALRFKHKLAGFDKEWSEEHYPYNRMIRYSNLSPGAYRFHLKVRNSLGVWSETTLSPGIVIGKPLYKQWWFYLLVLAAAVFLLYGVFRYFTQKRHAALLKKQVEERSDQLQAAENRYRNLFEESKDVVYISTPGGKFIDINPAGVELFGYKSKDELLSEASADDLYFNPAERETFRTTIEKQGYVKDYEVTLKGKENQKIAAIVTATSLREQGGKITAYRGTIRDIRDRKWLEQKLLQAQKMEAIGTLAGGIAHDFNNILGVISGNTEMLLDGLEKGTTLHQTTEQIAIATERAASLVKQILTFGRQNEKKGKPLKIGLVVEDVLNLLQTTLPGTIKIRKELQAISGIFTADRTQIHQLVMNLCTNAVYAMRETGGVLEVILDKIHLNSKSAKPFNDIKAGDYLRLIVSDGGRGIPPAVKKRIFEPYFTTKRTGEGSGMGLAVAYGIVKSHGGDITVYSETGKGTSFHVFLPVHID
jgi:PAS domain S-box-containing protein